MYVCICTHPLFICRHMYIHIHVRLYNMRIYTCMCVYMHVISLSTFIYRHTYIYVYMSFGREYDGTWHIQSLRLGFQTALLQRPPHLMQSGNAGLEVQRLPGVDFHV